MKIYSILKNSALAAAILASITISASAMKVVVVVSKVSQHMTVTVDGQKQYDWLVSTGGAGYETPSGTYHPFRLEKEHFSEEWDNAPMPYSMFFTGQGHAIHGSTHINRLGTRASHGCVRLAPANAATLFALVEKAGYKNSTFQINGGTTPSGYRLILNTGSKELDLSVGAAAATIGATAPVRVMVSQALTGAVTGTVSNSAPNGPLAARLNAANWPDDVRVDWPSADPAKRRSPLDLR